LHYRAAPFQAEVPSGSFAGSPPKEMGDQVFTATTRRHCRRSVASVKALNIQSGAVALDE